jgi:hypothetical protein
LIAAARDAAYEGYEGHGVLTYALLEAMQTDLSGAEDRIKVGTLADHAGERVPEISLQVTGVDQQPTRRLNGIDFPIGLRAAVLTPPDIPRTPTHVLIREERVREKAEPAAPGERTIPAGTQVRVVAFDGAWAVIAREGQRLGYVPADALVKLQ